MSSSSNLPFHANQPIDARDLTAVELLDAVGRHEPLALTEVYHRSVTAAHAVARRLMNDSDQIEQALTKVYAKLWADRPQGVSLEGWVRATSWAVGVETLTAAHQAPVSPSAAAFLPDLPAPDTRFIETAERAIADLNDGQRRALLLAHDQGVPTVEQGGLDATRTLVQALVALAGADEVIDEQILTAYPAIGDWAMGNATPAQEEAIKAAMETDKALDELGRTLRRGRRRIEGLPATPDMGARILVSILAAPHDAEATLRPPAPALDPVEAQPVAPVVDLGIIGDTEDQATIVEDRRPALDVLDLSGPLEPVTFDESALRLNDDDDNLEGGLLIDDPFGDEDDAPEWAPTGTDTSGMRLVDVIAGPQGDHDPFGDDLPAIDSEAMPRTAQSGRIEMITGRIDLDEPTKVEGSVIDFDDPTLATTQLQAIGPDGKEHLVRDPDIPFNKPANGVEGFLNLLKTNPMVREWGLPILIGVIVGLILGIIVY